MCGVIFLQTQEKHIYDMCFVIFLCCEGDGLVAATLTSTTLCMFKPIYPLRRLPPQKKQQQRISTEFKKKTTIFAQGLIDVVCI